MVSIIVLWIFLAIIAIIVILLHFSICANVKVSGDGVKVRVKYIFFTIYPRKSKPKKHKKNRKKKIKEKKTKDLFEDDIDDDFANVSINEDVKESAEIVSEDISDKLSKANGNIENAKKNVDDIAEDLYSEDVESLSESKAGNTISEKIIEKDKFGFDNIEENFDEEKKQSSSVNLKEKQKVKKVKKPKTKKGKKKKSEKKVGKLSQIKEMYEKYKKYIPLGWKYFKKLLKTIRFTDVDININVGRVDAHEAAIYYGAVQGALFNLLGNLANIFTFKFKRANVNCVFTENVINGEFETTVKIRPSALIAIVFCIGFKFLYMFLKDRFKRRREIRNQEKIKMKTEKSAQTIKN